VELSIKRLSLCLQYTRTDSCQLRFDVNWSASIVSTSHMSQLVDTTYLIYSSCNASSYQQPHNVPFALANVFLLLSESTLLAMTSRQHFKMLKMPYALSWLGKMAKSIFILFYFSFLFSQFLKIGYAGELDKKECIGLCKQWQILECI